MDSRKRSLWFLVLCIAGLAGGAGTWLGIKIAERAIRRDKSETSVVEHSLELRGEVLGQWIEEIPVRLSTVPLLSRSTLELKPDGTFVEAAELLTPERKPLKEMQWRTSGNWRTQSGEAVVLHVTTSTGPTTRPLGEYVFHAFAWGDELSLDASNSPDRGEESHTYKRLLAKRLTEADLEDARDSAREGIDDFRFDED